VAWVRDLGAHHVIDHRKPLAAEVEKLGIGAPGIVFSTTHTADHVDEIVKLLAPQGRLGLIDDPVTFDVVPFKQKSLSVHWELMFTRTSFDTVDLSEQGAILDEVSRLVDDGVLRTTLGAHLGGIDAASLRKAHALLESGTTKGKIVLEGFPARPTVE
jgi:zinc-binding alcohol dehydrogenase family protein